MLKNEREEWELPGGRLEKGEDPENCLIREIEEETRLYIQSEKLLDCWRYEILPQKEVLIITYGCNLIGSGIGLQISSEHKDARWVDVKKIVSWPMPQGYRDSIWAWAEVLRGNYDAAF